MPKGKKGSKKTKQDKEMELLGEFADKAQTMTNDDLKAELYSSQQIIHFNEEDLKKNEEIQQVNDNLKQLKAPYDETIKEHKTRIKYVLNILEGRGVALTRDKE